MIGNNRTARGFANTQGFDAVAALRFTVLNPQLFGADGEGILNRAEEGLSTSLASGICFLDGSLEKGSSGDSLDQGAADLIRDPRQSLRAEDDQPNEAQDDDFREADT